MKKLKLLGNMSKFSFAEMTSNTNGKTSATSTSGIYVIFIGGLCFLLGCIDKLIYNNSIDIINQSIMFTTIGAALLGVKNVVGSKIQPVEVEETLNKETQEEPSTSPQ